MFWPPDQEKVFAEEYIGSETATVSFAPPCQTECMVGSELSRMVANPEVMLQVATGGKGNDLKLWNGNRLDAPVFQAKNVCPVSMV